jgi:WhiB family redox-sensing transcriptional regulator
MTWRDRAACLNEDPELFFPIGNTGPALIQIEEAKAVCRRCEVIGDCLSWAMDSRQEDGVWGGTVGRTTAGRGPTPQASPVLANGKPQVTRLISEAD